MLYRCTSVVVACLIGACGGTDNIATNLPWVHPGPALGTAADDIWSLGSSGKDGQDDPYDLTVDYWDGSSVRPVAISPTIFNEGACGLPSASAAVSHGEVWLASIHVPKCGLTSDQAHTYEKLIFGKLKADGTWEDHSADFPEGAAGAYRNVWLAGRDGVLWVVTQGGMNHLVRYAADGSHMEVAPPPGGAGSPVQPLGADELMAAGYLYSGGSWQPISAPPPGGTNMMLVGGECWALTGLGDQQTMTTVYQCPHGVYTAIPVMTAAGAPFTNEFVSLAIKPRGGTKFSWYFVERGITQVGGLTILKRDFDGTVLGAPETISKASCDGTPDQCLPGDARMQLLSDGSPLVQGHYVVSIDDL